ncbi:MAG: glycosyl hydrolase [Rhodothermales bacterium]|nr:glycosyl hydrolase [Rhodothermales bacterium]
MLSKNAFWRLLGACLLAAGWSLTDVCAQTVRYDTTLYSALDYRSLGPYRGGRSAAVTGVVGQPLVHYFGATGGGVWKSTDGGSTWRNVSDGYFGGSIGAVAVSEWDPNVIYVGGGEKTVRGNVSHGYGMWKSEDAGKTWRNIGLNDTRHIPRVRIHPKNPDLVYVAALGHLYGPNDQRGVFRSEDGGATWEKILFVDDEAGAVDLYMDPTNPRNLWATFWQVKRTPYSLESGGPHSSLWRSTDGGDTWREVTGRDNGLPGGTLGIIGVTVSPADPDRVWAIVEAAEGGVYRSDDDGASWRRINDDRNLRQRAWYYTRIYAGPQDPDRVCVLNVQFWCSKDGGRTYEDIDTPHGDHHDLWIDPDDPDHMAVADDGGAQVSYDRGANWTTYHNQPTAQFYRVTTDNHFPYRIYGAQQDNSTVRILHRTEGFGIGEDAWEPTAGGESGHIAPHPDNPDVVYGGSYGGFLTRVDHETGEVRAVNVWPDNPMGHGAKDLRYRFQWNFPILFSPHRDPATGDYPLYAAANVLFRTTDEGQSWTPISPDLTRADTTMLGPSGGPITKDNTSVEYYATIFAVAESPHEAGVIWAGSDDGLIHITRDGGQTWTDVTPSARILPEFAQINDLIVDPHNPGGVYVAATRYKLDDFRPYLYKSDDYGQTWTKITDGIDPLHFTRAIEADPAREGLLYAGTESGMYVSFDDGASWHSFQRNLPVVPITDIEVKDHDLVVATQGRSFWVMDDLTPLHQLSDRVAASAHWLFQPRPAYRLGGRGGGSDGRTRGDNPPAGAVFHYYLADVPDSSAASFRILENDGTIIETFTPAERRSTMPLAAGLNQLVWDMDYADAEGFDGLILWAGGLGGPTAVPGTYRARLVLGEDSTEVPFEILPDPRASSSLADVQAQFDFLIDVRDKLTETHRAIKQIREVRQQVKAVTGRVPEENAGKDAIKEAGEALIAEITAVEEALYQTKNESRQDPLNFPIKLNNRLSALAGVVGRGAFRPTAQAVAVKDMLVREIDAELAKLRDVMATDLPAFNQLVRQHEVPAVMVETEAAPPAGTQ